MRSGMLNWKTVWVGVSWLTLAVQGCAGTAPVKPPPHPQTTRTPRGWNLPYGCDRSLAGTYEHATDPRFRYVAEDDGQKLVLSVELLSADAGTASTEGGVLVRLERTSHGLVGQTLATGFNASRHGCAVEFPTSVKSCEDDSLLLESLMSTAIDEACQADPQRGSVGVEQHLLRRVKPEEAPRTEQAPAEGDAGVTAPGP